MEKDNFKLDDFIAIYTDVNSGRFGLGKVIALDNNSLLIKSVELDGTEGGIVLYRLNEICMYEKDSLYCQKMHKLMQLKKTKLNINEYVFKSDNIMIELLKLAHEKNVIVDIELMDSHTSNVIGLISSLNDSVCEIQQIDDFGCFDGTCTFSLDIVSGIIFNEIKSKDRQLLYNNQNNSAK